MLRKSIILSLIVFAVTALAAQPRGVDIGDSRVVVRVFRAGIFGGFGDNHEIVAPITYAVLDEPARQITLRFDARQMRVVDPNLSPDKRAEVQQRMLGPEVLDVAQFPEITFQSTSVRDEGAGRLAVTGTLHLHGQARAVTGTAISSSSGYRGTFRLKQREFGIKPVSIAGGTIKVKDEISIEFDIRPAKPQ